MDETTITWFKSYLNHRSQYVHTAGQFSSIKKVSQGIPQGSVLGPVLFTIFMNNINEATKDDLCQHHASEDDNLFGSNCLKCGITPAYADDATHIVRSNMRDNNQQQLSNNLKSIAIYLEANQLSINQGKTQLLESMVHQKRSKISGNPLMLTVLLYWIQNHHSRKIHQTFRHEYVQLPKLGCPSVLWWTSSP